MKKMAEYLLLSLFAMAAILVLPAVSEAADDDPTVTITDGASIRTNADSQGMRFKIRITNPDKAEDYGIVLSYMSGPENQTKKTKTISKSEGFTKIYAQGTHNGVPWKEYTAVIIGLNPAYFATDFSAEGFVTCNSNTVYALGTDGQKKTVKRNIQQVAAAAGYVLDANTGALSQKNWALTSTVSSTFGGEGALANIIDGVRTPSDPNNKRWRIDTSAQTIKDSESSISITFALTSGLAVETINLFSQQRNGDYVEPTLDLTTDLAIASFIFEYYDGSGWVEIPNGNVTGNNKVWNQISLNTPVVTSQIRLTLSKGQGYARLLECEIFGTPTTLDGWQTIDLSQYTPSNKAGLTYDSVTKTITAVNAGDFGFKLPVPLKFGEKARFIVKGNYNDGGAAEKGFRYWLTTDNVGIRGSAVCGVFNPAGDFKYTNVIESAGIDGSTENNLGKDTSLLSFKGLKYGAAVNGTLTITSIMVNYDPDDTFDPDNFGDIIYTKQGAGGMGSAFQMTLEEGKTFADVRYIQADTYFMSSVPAIRVYASNKFGKASKTVADNSTSGLNDGCVRLSSEWEAFGITQGKWSTATIPITVNGDLASFTGKTADFSIYAHATAEFKLKNIKLLDSNNLVIGTALQYRDGKPCFAAYTYNGATVTILDSSNEQ